MGRDLSDETTTKSDTKAKSSLRLNLFFYFLVMSILTGLAESVMFTIYLWESGTKGSGDIADYLFRSWGGYLFWSFFLSTLAAMASIYLFRGDKAEGSS